MGQLRSQATFFGTATEICFSDYSTTDTRDAVIRLLPFYTIWSFDARGRLSQTAGHRRSVWHVITVEGGPRPMTIGRSELPILY